MTRARVVLLVGGAVLTVAAGQVVGAVAPAVISCAAAPLVGRWQAWRDVRNSVSLEAVQATVADSVARMTFETTENDGEAFTSRVKNPPNPQAPWYWHVAALHPTMEAPVPQARGRVITGDGWACCQGHAYDMIHTFIVELESAA